MVKENLLTIISPWQVCMHSWKCLAVAGRLHGFGPRLYLTVTAPSSGNPLAPDSTLWLWSLTRYHRCSLVFFFLGNGDSLSSKALLGRVKEYQGHLTEHRTRQLFILCSVLLSVVIPSSVYGFTVFVGYPSYSLLLNLSKKYAKVYFWK